MYKASLLITILNYMNIFLYYNQKTLVNKIKTGYKEKTFPGALVEYGTEMGAGARSFYRQLQA